MTKIAIKARITDKVCSWKTTLALSERVLNSTQLNYVISEYKNTAVHSHLRIDKKNESKIYEISVNRYKSYVMKHLIYSSVVIQIKSVYEWSWLSTLLLRFEQMKRKGRKFRFMKLAILNNSLKRLVFIRMVIKLERFLQIEY